MILRMLLMSLAAVRRITFSAVSTSIVRSISHSLSARGQVCAPHQLRLVDWVAGGGVGSVPACAAIAAQAALLAGWA